MDHTLTIMPTPEDFSITAKEALRWLHEDLPLYQAAIFNYIQYASPAQLNGLTFLSMDLRTMTEACTGALTTRTTQRVVEAHEVTDSDYDAHVGYLAEAVSARGCQDATVGPFELAYDVLAEELCRRVKELGEYTAKLRRPAA